MAAERMQLTEPDYGSFIDPKLIRRMSRIIRMGVATAMDALKQAGLAQPSAILVGTAYGCLDDTGVFLKKMVEQEEEMLTPTSFIQSTHNTVGAQIALLLKCHSYNNTYVQGVFSFESALLDTWLLLQENPAQQVLAGSAEELTTYSFEILKRFGMYRHRMASEGAAFFVAGGERNDKTLAECRAVSLFYAGNSTALSDRMVQLAAQTGRPPQLLLTAAPEIFPDPLPAGFGPAFPFKDACGEYPTATGFATWLAIALLQENRWPEWLGAGEDSPACIWVHQYDGQGKHSFIVLQAC